jgi:uncharacterized repeat protein (TIGR03803 family)
VLAIVVLFAASSAAFSQRTEKLLHAFNTTNGKSADNALVFDASGNLYGVTSAGGTYSGGVAYMLSRNQSGTWIETVLHNFGNTKNKDGAEPYNNSLIFDSAGNLYGTTYRGGTFDAGTVFEISPAAGGKWTETILYNFAGGTSDGLNPEAGLAFDSAGNLYGTTFLDGTYTKGTAFELSPAPGGGWTEKVIWNFGNGTDGANPVGALVLDIAGNLYGTTSNGGVKNYGTVYELSRVGGSWTITTLHNFGTSQDGIYPYSTLVFDAVGNLFGTTTSGGGPNRDGIVFELSPVGGGAWTETIVHAFGAGTDGYDPYAEQLVFDTAGNLYGTTFQGGAHGDGTVFKLSPSSSGLWTETLLHVFKGSFDGAGPFGVILDRAGNIYGTTAGGGSSGNGVVYEIIP